MWGGHSLQASVGRAAVIAAFNGQAGVWQNRDVPQRVLESRISQLASSQLVPKLYLGTKMVAKLSLADKGGVPSSAWE